MSVSGCLTKSYGQEPRKSGRLRYALLWLVVWVVVSACAAHAPSTAQVRVPSERPLAPEMTREGALLRYQRSLDEYQRGADARVVGAGFGHLNKDVSYLVDLAHTYPPAANDIKDRCGNLAALIARDPEHVSGRVFDVYLELSRQTQSFDQVRDLLTKVTSAAPQAHDARRRLLGAVLEWLQRHDAYADIYANRDVLEEELANDLEFAEFYAKRGRESATTLYEVLVATGRLDEAARIAERALSFGEPAHTLCDLLRLATRAAATSEVARLSVLTHTYGPCEQATESSTPPVTR